MVGGWSTRGVEVGVDEPVGLVIGPPCVGLVVAVGAFAVRGRASGLAAGGADVAGEGQGAAAGVSEGMTSRDLVAPAGLTISCRCPARDDAATNSVKTSAAAQIVKTPAIISSVMPFRMARVSCAESPASGDYTKPPPRPSPARGRGITWRVWGP
jgi:hypothetical protein